MSTAAAQDPTPREGTDPRAHFLDSLAEAAGGLMAEGEHTAVRTPSEAIARGVPEQAVLSCLARALSVPYLEHLDGAPISQEFLQKVPISHARRHAVLALASENGSTPVALGGGAGSLGQLQIVSRILGRPVHPVLAPAEAVLRAINAAYSQRTGQAQRVIEELDGRQLMDQLEQMSATEDLLDVNTRAPVIKLVNLLLFEAVKRRASDVHVQPYEDRLVVRLRIDGVLYDVFCPPRALQAEIISRIKVMGGMNIAERRLAQDGRATVEVGDRLIDLRIATLPTSFGERAVIRLLDKSIRMYELGELGMPGEVLTGFRQLIRHDHGIILVTGPTGSGKSTTLYAALKQIDAREKNILTLEDPIEYRLEGISQTQVNDKKGMTFTSGLRNVLRQDPDVIMVGEIRDGETASMAIQSALTGHLVFSTLHTNDASGAVARLLDLGTEPYLVASSLLGVLAQRLVRRICPACKQAFEPAETDYALWGPQERSRVTLPQHRGAGCPECMGSGYHERLGIFELLEVDEPLRELILRREKASTLKQSACRHGMRTLRADGIDKANAGRTTMDEVARVTSRDDEV